MKMTEMMRSGGKLVESPRGEVPARAQDQVYEEFLVHLKVRNAGSDLGWVVRTALAASDDIRFTTFLDRVHSSPGTHLVTIAKNCQISLAEFQAFFRAVKTNEAVLIATNNLPSLTKDLVADAATAEDTCPACGGTGQIQREGKEDRICPNCSGKGVIRSIGDKHARDKLLEMTGVVKRDAPVQVNLDMRGLGMGAASTRLQKVVPFDLDTEVETE
jgi:hypothetical protein